MLQPLSKLSKAEVITTDNETGRVADLFFDDRDWTIRYLVVDIGAWLFGSTTLIAPAAVQQVEWDRKRITLNLSRKQIEKSPDIDIRKPISRKRELEIFTFYGWPEYWPATGFTSVPPMSPSAHALQPILSMEDELAAPTEHFEDSSLRRLAEARSCRLWAADGEAGRPVDFLMDDASWSIRYAIVAVSPKGREIAIPTDRLGHPRWQERQLTITLSIQSLQAAPAYDQAKIGIRDEENKFRRYFNGL
ncbi:MAG: PRC-barrel domain-containing protein [Deltaproteobacteria bacterium]